MEIDLDDVQCLKETKVTVRGYRRRTIIPKEIAEILELKNDDIIFWIAMKDGRVLLKKPEVESD